jgi:glycoprotein endo-alpha-1,2-mannosidase
MRRDRSLTPAPGAVLALALLALTLPATGAGRGSSESAPAAAEAAIFYYPWYSTPKSDGHWAHWYVPAADGRHVLSTPYYPARGLYSSSNAKVVGAQMREIAAAGIRTVIVSWWGWNSPEDRRLPLVIDAASAHRLRVAIHHEPYHGRTPASTAGDIEALRTKGITDFYVYDADRSEAAEWATALAELDGVRVFAHTHLVGRAKAAGFDGLYTYDIATWHGRTFARTCKQARRVGLLCAPSVGPGYDARLATSDEVVRPRQHGATYDRMWRAALRAKPDLVTITSYNEWQEGTQIEPARVQVQRQAYEGAWGRYGMPAQRAYLDATAQWVSRLRAAAGQ